MASIIKLVKEIETRPAMYIGKNSISCLKAFLDGWYLRDTNNVEDVETMDEFQNWISKKYNIKSNQSWDRVILFYSQDENDSLKNYFIEFNEFISSLKQK